MATPPRVPAPGWRDAPAPPVTATGRRVPDAGARRRDHAPATTSLRNLLQIVLCLLAATIPNESIFVSLSGSNAPAGQVFRTPTWYLGIAATVISVLYVPRLVRLATRSSALLLMLAAYATGLLILVALVWTGDGGWRPEYQIDRQFKSIYMALLFLVLTTDPQWRRRLVLSYVGGWAIFVLITLALVSLGRADVIVDAGATRTSVLGMNVNVQSTFAASGTVLVFVEAINAPTLRLRALGGAAFFPGLAASLVGSSRSGTISLVFALLFVLVAMMVRNPREISGGRLSGARARLALALVVVVAIGALLSSEFGFLGAETRSLSTRMDAALAGRNLGERDILARRTWEMFLHSPAGSGMGTTWDVLRVDPHNGYLKLLAEGGVVGGLFFLAGALMVVANARAWMKRPEEIGPVACLVLFAISAAASQALVESPFWLFFAFYALPPPARDPRGVERKEEPETSPKGRKGVPVLARGSRTATFPSSPRRA